MFDAKLFKKPCRLAEENHHHGTSKFKVQGHTGGQVTGDTRLTTFYSSFAPAVGRGVARDFRRYSGTG